MSDINTAVLDSLKVLDPNRPIREADISKDLARRRLDNREKTILDRIDPLHFEIRVFKQFFVFHLGPLFPSEMNQKVKIDELVYSPSFAAEYNFFNNEKLRHRQWSCDNF